jgi:hypothetical protein
MADENEKRHSSGCAILFLLALPLLDTFGMLMSYAGPYCPVVLIVGLVGFVCGAAVGAYVSVKVKHSPWWSSCRWAIYGLLGMCLPVLIASSIILRLR